MDMAGRIRRADDAGRDLPPKGERCRLSGCPLAGLGDPRCEMCSGPVAWKDADGNPQGRARSCSSCAMDGLGLPVCWAACPGPRDDLANDGQCMVRLGGMNGDDGMARFVGGHMAVDALAWTRGRGSASHDGTMARLAASRMLAMDSASWTAFRKAVDADDREGMARAAQMPRSAFSPGSDALKLARQATRLDARHWEVVRLLAAERSQSDVARMTGGLSKQAVNTMLRRIAKRHDWVARLVYYNGGAHVKPREVYSKDGTLSTKKYQGKNSVRRAERT